MFSGIVERVGTVEGAERAGGTLRLAIHGGFEVDPSPGESIAVNGVCLTVERALAGVFEVVAVGETLGRTTLDSFTVGRHVNLERALRVGDTLGGHLVQGHVDGLALIRAVERDTAGTRLSIVVPRELCRYVARKGSIAVDGVSLTVATWSEPIADLALVPYTIAHTVASEYASGDLVNLEVDLVARYLDRLLEARGLAGAAEGVAPGAESDR